MTSRLLIAIACVAVTSTLAAGQQPAPVITISPNINVLRDITDPVRGDALLQRQNEPVVAISTRNPEHVMVAANDYRTVDVADDEGIGEIFTRAAHVVTEWTDRLMARLTGRGGARGEEEEEREKIEAGTEAWVGVYVSNDRGRNWTNAWMPGYPQDSSRTGQSTPAYGRQAASDPVLAAAPAGRFYLGAMAFDRGGVSKILVSRFTDLNNSETGNNFHFDLMRAVDNGRRNRIFLDKPAIVADVARSSSDPAACGPVHIAFTAFDEREPDPMERSKILVSTSLDCGNSWLEPKKVNHRSRLVQGVALAIRPSDGAIFAAYRSFSENKIYVTSSTNLGHSFSQPVSVSGTMLPFDQPTLGAPDYSFRTNGFPTIAISGAGVVYVAWQERLTVNGNPRILITSSPNGTTWSAKAAVEPQRCVITPPAGAISCGDTGPQIMPSLAFSRGRLMLIFYEGRAGIDDVKWVASQKSSYMTGLGVELYLRVAQLDATGRGSSAVATQYELDKDGQPALITNDRGTVYRAAHRPNLPMYQGGTSPFIGDYIFLAPVSPFVADSSAPAARNGNRNGQRDDDEGRRNAKPPSSTTPFWRWATEPADAPSATFQAVWTDNRDVVFPRDPITGLPRIDGKWNDYAPPGGGPCINPGARNANVYATEITSRLVAGSPTTFKQLGIQRAFVLYVQNRSAEHRFYRLTIADSQAVNGSFRQTGDDQNVLDVEVFPFSTVTENVFITADNAAATQSVRVDIVEINQQGGTLVIDGDATAVVFNADASNPQVANVSPSSELHTPRIFNPDDPTTTTPRISNPQVANPQVANPQVANPQVANPQVANPQVANPQVANLQLTNSPYTDVGSQILTNVTNYTWQVANAGNTVSAFTPVFNIANQAALEGKKVRLIVYNTYYKPTFVQNAAGRCVAVEEPRDEIISVVENPQVANRQLTNPQVANPQVANPQVANPQVANSTFYIAPSDTTPQVAATRPRSGARVRLVGLQTPAADNDESTLHVRPPATYIALSIQSGDTPIVGAPPPPPAPGEPPPPFNPPLTEADFTTGGSAVGIVSTAAPVIDGVVQPTVESASTGPDLAIAVPPVIAPGSVQAAGLISMSSFQVTNAGDQATAAGFRYGIYLSTTQLVDPGSATLLGFLTSPGSLAQGESVTVAGGTFGIPAATSDGPYYVGVFINDGQNYSPPIPPYLFESFENNSFVAPITVSAPAAPPPTAVSDSYSVNEDATLNVEAPGVLSNDGNTGAVTAVLSIAPGHGTLTLNSNGSFTYVPQPNYFGPDSFTYFATDGVRASPPTVAAITVVAVNDPPTFTIGPDQTVASTAGPQTIAGWATGISAGPANESTQTVGFVLVPEEAALFSAQPQVAANGTLTFTPSPAASGTTAVHVTVRDNGGTENGGVDATTRSFLITVTGGVNHAPTFTRGADVTVLEDAAAQTVVGWATEISPGADSEAAQALNFIVSTGSDSLFAVQPAIAPNGTLTFALAPNRNGTAQVTVRLHDDGGTSNEGLDTSAPQTFVITVEPVNDAPTFTRGPDQSVASSAGQVFVNWATNISAGPADEATQTLTFVVMTEDQALFSVQPTIDAAGTLRFAAASNQVGQAQLTVELRDSGGVANGGVDTSAPQTFTISVTINHSPVAVDDRATTFENTPVDIDVLANDFDDDADSGDTINIASIGAAAHGSVASTAGSRVLRYTPQTGFTGVDSFTYTISDSHGATTQATVSIVVETSLAITTAALNDAILFQTFSQGISAIGGHGSRLFTVDSGALPPGVTLTSSGSFSGAPTATGAFNFVVRVTDCTPSTSCATGTTQQTATQALTLNVSVIDQSAGFDTTKPALAFGGSGGLRFGQRITTGVTGTLRGFRVSGTTCPTGATLSVDVEGVAASGAPDGVSIASGSGPATSFGVIPLAPFRFFAADQQFTVVVGSSAACTMQPAGSNVYGGGDGYASAAPWQPLVDYSAGQAYDIPFATVVQPVAGLSYMTQSRGNHQAIALNDGRILIATGGQTADIYDPSTGTFTATGNMSVGRSYSTATLLDDGTVLFTGGTPISGGAYLASAELYHPDTGTFELLPASLSTGRAFHTATRLVCPPLNPECSWNGKVLVAGGAFYDGATVFNYLTATELYDPASRTFASSGTLLAGRYSPTATRLTCPSTSPTCAWGGKVLFAGGFLNSSSGPSGEIFDPSTGTSTRTSNDMLVPRWTHTATLLANGQVLIAGGSSTGTGGALRQGEVFDPINGRFTAAGEQLTTRVRHTATLLGDGTVLLVGGQIDTVCCNRPPLVVIERYIPGTGFVGAGSLKISRYLHTASTLPNGSILIAGGFSNSAIAGRSAELIDVATGPSIVNPILPTGALNSAYSVLLGPKGGSGPPYSFALASPAPLPPGLALDTITCLVGCNVTIGTSISGPIQLALTPPIQLARISGTPTAAGTYSFDLRVTDGTNHSADQTLTIRINPLDITSPLQLANAHLGVPFLTVLTASGTGPFTWTVVPGSSLPAGLTLNSNGTITGTPTQTQFSSFTARVMDAFGQTATATFSLFTDVYIDQGHYGDGSSVNSLSIAGASRIAQTVSAGLTGYLGAVRFPTLTCATNPITVTIQGVSATSGTPDDSQIFSTVTATVTGTYQTIVLPSPLFFAADARFALVLSSPTGSCLVANASVGSDLTSYHEGAAFADSGSGWARLSDGPTGIADIQFETAATSNSLVHTTYLGNSRAIRLANGKALFVGDYGSAELYEPATNSSSTRPMQARRVWATATLLNDGRVLVTGGVDTRTYPNPWVYHSTAEIYDPALDAFVPVSGSMSIVRFFHRATLLSDGRVLVTGGVTSPVDPVTSQYGPTVKTVEIFDPTTGAFTQVAPMIDFRQAHEATLLNDGRVLVTGGFGGSTFPYVSSELYTPGVNTWIAAGAMLEPRGNHTATRLSNGTVLVAGGQLSRAAGMATLGEIFSPNTNSFTTAGALIAPRMWHSAVTLNDGSVLLSGGVRNTEYFGAPWAAVERYVPGSGFLGAASLLVTRYNHGAALLGDGRVVVGGGWGSSQQSGNTIEVYDPRPAQGTPGILNPNPPDGSRNVPYGPFTFAPTGGAGQPYSLALVPPAQTLPPGLTFDVVSCTVGCTISNGTPVTGPIQLGRIAGTPTDAGTYTFDVRVTDKAGKSGDQALTIRIDALEITTALLPEAHRGQSYSGPLTATGVAPIAWSVISGSLPPGLSIAGGAITGTVSASAVINSSYSFTVRAVDAAGQRAVKNLWIYVQSPIQITTPTLPEGLVAEYYFQCLGASFGSGNRTWAIAAGSLPRGVTLQPYGCFADAPLQTGTFTFTVRVTDSSSPPQSDQREVTWSISAIDQQAFSDALGGRLTIGGASQQRVAQIITAGATGWVTGVQLQQTECTTGSVRSGSLYPVTGNPPVPDDSGPALATGTVPQFDLALWFDRPVFTPVGSQYALVFSSNGECTLDAVRLNNYYAGGRALISTSPSGGWADASMPDLTFRVAVRPSAPLTYSLQHRPNTRLTQLVDGRFLVTGGSNTGSLAEIYDPATATLSPTSGGSGERRDWSTATLLGCPDAAPGCAYGGKVLIVGGENYTGFYSATAEIFDPNTGRFTPTGSLAIARSQHTATQLADGRVLIAGGWNGAHIGTAEIFDATTNGGAGAFTTIAQPMVRKRSQHTATLLTVGTDQGKVLIAGGWQDPTDANVSVSVELFDPLSNTFSAIGTGNSVLGMQIPRAEHTATLLPDGHVLFIGGRWLGGSLADRSEIFTPATLSMPASFAQSGALNTPRHYHSATLLPDGSVLVAGGFDHVKWDNVATADTERWNPATGLFTGTGSMAVARSRVASAVLTCRPATPSCDYAGKVLFAGGDALSDVAGRSLEAFDPSTAIGVAATHLPDAGLAVPYSYSIAGSAGVGPYHFTLVSGTLPAGLTLDNNGVVSGIATTREESSFVVQVVDGAGHVGYSRISIRTAPSLRLAKNLFHAIAGAPFSGTQAAEGGAAPLLFQVEPGFSAVPPGLTFNSSGIVAGTPTAGGHFSFVARATDSGSIRQSVTQRVRVNVASVDQRQTDESVPDLELGTTVDTILGQVVTAGVTGTLAHIAFPLYCSPGGTVTVEVRSASFNSSVWYPGGFVYTVSTINADAFPGPTETWRTVSFADPPFFRAGDRFAIVLTASNHCFVNTGGVISPYPGGDLSSATPESPTSWTPAGGRDLAFRTLVEPISLANNGHAAVDGIIAADEWSSSGQVNFLLKRADALAAPATFMVMNDASDVHMAVVFEDDPRAAAYSLNLNADNTNIGRSYQAGEDLWSVSGNGIDPAFFGDSVASAIGCPNPPNACRYPSDTSSGGTNDGRGAVAAIDDVIAFEVSHPLNSHDPNDVALAIGSIFGINFNLYVGLPSSSQITQFPASSQESVPIAIVGPATGAALLSVNPVGGQQGQSLDVSLTGRSTHWLAGATSVSFGAGITVTTTTVEDATRATAHVVIDPTAALGARTVTMTTGIEIVTADNSFFVTAGAAALSSVVPPFGHQGQTLSVDINGTNTHFAQGITLASFISDIGVNSLTVRSLTSATANITIAPGALAGLRTITMTTGGESASRADAFAVVTGTAIITSVSPPTGHQAESLLVRVTGQFTNFVQGATQASFGSGITVNSVSVLGPTAADVHITIDPAAALGSRPVTLTTFAEVASQVGGFTVLAGVPTVTQSNPTVGRQGQSLTVVLTGQFTNFVQGVTTVNFGGGITAGAVTVNGPALLSVPITIQTWADVGTRTVWATTGSEVAVGSNVFTVLAGAPAITVIDPNVGQIDRTVTVNVSAQLTNFQNGITVASFGPGISVGGAAEGALGPVNVSGPGSFSAQLTINAAATLGPRDVVVKTNTDIQAVPGGFTVTDVDTTPPGTMYFSPAYGATDVPLNAIIVVEFNEPISRSTVTSSSFLLYDNLTGLRPAATISVDASGRLLTFVPNQLLAVDRSYSINLTGAITDAAGNSLGYGYSYFTTGFSTDTTGPALTATNPSDNDTGVPLNTKLMLQFDKAINPITLAAGVHVEAGDVSLRGAFSLSDGDRRIAFQPTVAFDAESVITMTVSDQLLDTAGNALTNPRAFRFTAGTSSDTTSPFVTATSPLNGATGVARNVVPRVVFSEPINPITVNARNFFLTHSFTGQLQPTTVVVAPDRLSATLTPWTPLRPNERYNVALSNIYASIYCQSYFYYDGSCYLDIAGNPGNNTTFEFVTGSNADGTAPMVIAISPSPSAANVPVNARVVVRVNEPIDPQSVATQTVRLAPAVAGAVTLAADRQTLTFTADALLTAGTPYSVTVSGLRDVVGNVMVPFTSTFTTGGVTDTTAPTVVATTPANGATGVSVTTPIVWTLSEPIVASTVDENTLSVATYVPATGYWVAVAGSLTVAPDGQTITFTPASQYPANATIYLQVSGNGAITDAPGNVLAFDYRTFTTAGTPDTTGPTVTSVTPPPGTVSVGLASEVVLTFSESMSPNTLNSNTLALYAGATRLSPGISWSADGRTVVLRYAPLPAASTMTVIATHDITDLAGNPIADFSSRFTTIGSLDAGRPSVVTQRPGNGATEVPASSPITLFVNEPLNAATVAAGLFVSQNGVLITGSAALTSGGRVVQFKPDVAFRPGALVQVFLTEAVQDLAGNAVNSYVGQVTIAPDASVAPFAIVRTSPGWGESNVVLNSVIDTEFNRALDPATVVEANIRLVDNNTGASVPSAIVIEGVGAVVRLVPAGPLTPNTYYYVLPGSGLRDVQGTAYTGSYWYFYTGATTDSTTPAVTGVSPPAGASNVGVNAEIHVRFSERVNPITVTETTLRVSSGGLSPVPATISFSYYEPEVVVLTPLAALPAGATVTLVIDGVEDPAGHPVAAQTTTFVTAAAPDFTPPQVIASSVFDGETDVPVNAVFTVEFSEPIDPQSLANGVQIYDYVTGQTRIAVTTLSADGRRMSLASPTALGVVRPHSINISVRDVSGNAGSFSFYFTTALFADSDPPHVVFTNPENAAESMPINASLQVLFDEPIDPTSVGQVNLLAGNGPLDVTRTWSNVNRTLKLTPAGLLAPNTRYTISIAGARDTSGNVLGGTTTATFGTGPGADLIAPAVTRTNPPNGATGVGRNVVVRVEFSERINPITVNAANFVLTRSYSGQRQPAVVAVAPDRLSATLTPLVPLQSNERYDVSLSGAYYYYCYYYNYNVDNCSADIAGNQGNGTTFGFVTGDAGDTTAPTVTAISPTPAASGVPLNARIIVHMSEPMDVQSVPAVVRLTPDAIGGVTLAADRQTITFTPSAPLAASSPYSVVVSGLRDVTGNVMVPFMSSFTTGAVADTTAPTVIATTPEYGATGVAVTAPIVWTLSEPIVASAVDENTVSVAAYLPAIGYWVAVAGRLTVAPDGQTITFTPASQYPANATIYMQVNSNGAITDAAGNVLPFDYRTFTTASTPDTTGPTVTSVTPPPGTVSVGLASEVVLTFSESMSPNTLNSNTLALYAGATRLSPGITWSADGRTVVMHSAPLPAASAITVVGTHDITDLAGNAVADFSSTFTTTGSVDAGRPSVVTQRPGNGATEVPASSPITLFLNEPMNAATVAAGLFVSQNGVLITGAIALTSGGQVVQFTPDVPFVAGALVQVFVTEAVQDLVGNAVNSYVGQVTIAPDASVAPFAIVRTSPGWGESNVVLNSVIDTEFNRALDPATVMEANIRLVDNNTGASVPSAIVIEGVGAVVRLVPAGPLTPNTYYYLLPGSGLRDRQGTAYTGSYWYFYTGAATDSTTPAVTAVSPPAGASNVGVNAAIHVQFSEPVNPITVRETTLRVSGAGQPAIPASISFSNDNTEVVVTPLAALPAGATITLVIDGVEDPAGHAVAAQTTTFVTAAAPDFTPPQVVGFTPFYGETDVPVNAVIKIEFNEPIDPTSTRANGVGLYDYSTGYVPTTTSLGPDGRTLMVVPAGGLGASRYFSVGVSFRDLSGNANSVGFSFSTEAASDTTAPRVLALSPGDQLAGVPRNAVIQVLFDEPIDGTSLDDISLVAAGLSVPVTQLLSNANRTLTLLPAVLMSGNAVHVLTVDGVTDSAGNPLAGPVTATFTTSTSVDLVGPSVTTQSPANGATDVATSTSIQVTFNERLDVTTLPSNAFVLRVWATGEPVQSTLSVSPDLRTVIATPIAPLAAGTIYQVFVNYNFMTDLAGNSVTYTVSTVFTTAP